MTLVRPIVMLLAVAALGCGAEPGLVPHSLRAEAEVESRVLILTAMPIELAPILEMAEVESTTTINGRTHHLGRLSGVPVVLAAGGISMVNATMAAQAAVSELPVRAIVFCGIAGGASPEIRIADVMVPAQWAQYQENVFTDAARTGWRRGWRDESLGSFGMAYPQRVWTTRESAERDAEELKLWFRVDATLLAAAGTASADVMLDRCTVNDQCVEHQPSVVLGGNGVSGPTFVDDASYRDWVYETFAPDGFDMETAAVGHVAYVNDIPYIGVRGISDMAGATHGENRVESYAPMAARNAAIVVAALLAVWPGS